MVPPYHPLKNRVFHYKPSILGYPYCWKHPSRNLVKLSQVWGFRPMFHLCFCHGQARFLPVWFTCVASDWLQGEKGGMRGKPQDEWHRCVCKPQDHICIHSLQIVVLESHPGEVGVESLESLGVPVFFPPSLLEPKNP